MANQWLRLWHDMPNDPKWRTIARVSGQPISLVISTYVALLVSASQNVTRGHANVTAEDLASQFDVTEDEITAVLNAMQGRVLDGFKLTGWETRQPKREDQGNAETGAKSAAERKRAQREREKLAAEMKDGDSCHDASRNVTPDKDKEKIREEINIGANLPQDENKEEKAKPRFVPPTVDQIAEYCQERKNGINPQSFVDHYQSKGWMIGKNRMKDWKAAVRTWEASNSYSQARAPYQPQADTGRGRRVL